MAARPFIELVPAASLWPLAPMPIGAHLSTPRPPERVEQACSALGRPPPSFAFHILPESQSALWRAGLCHLCAGRMQFVLRRHLPSHRNRLSRSESWMVPRLSICFASGHRRRRGLSGLDLAEDRLMASIA
jgi:hypothetical protein